MSDNRINFLDPALQTVRPVVLEGGASLVPVPRNSKVEVGRSRWGVEVTLTPRPKRSDPAYPSWPLLEPKAVKKAARLLKRVNRTGEPLGYLGPNEAELERRVARDIARFAPAGAPPVHVFACKSGTAAELIMYMAILYKRFAVERRELVWPPAIVASALSFEANWTTGLKAFAKVKFADTDGRGCMDVHAAEAAITPKTQILIPTALYDQNPDLRGFRELANRRGLALAFDGAHGLYIRDGGIHVVYLVDVLMDSGQGSKPKTPGAEYGFIATCDPVLAAFIAQLRNVGRIPNPLPDWWPDGITHVRLLGDNARAGEVDAILMNGSINLHWEMEANRTVQLRALRDGLTTHPELPWRMLPEQPDVEGLFYKAFLVFAPEGSNKAEAWASLGTERTMEWLARELLTEVAHCYPPPDDPASEYHPQVPWVPRDLIPDIGPQTYPTARRLSAAAQLLPHEFLARRGGAEQALGAMLKMHRWVDHPEIQAWSPSAFA